jgi:putative membrane protein
MTSPGAAEVFWGPWSDFGWVAGLLWAIFWVVVIVLAIVLLRRELPHMHSAERHRPPALDLLEERYARGEITRDEFLERRAVLMHGGQSAPSGPPPPPSVVLPEPPPGAPGAPTMPLSDEAAPEPTTDLPSSEPPSSSSPS